MSSFFSETIAPKTNDIIINMTYVTGADIKPVLTSVKNYKKCNYTKKFQAHEMMTELCNASILIFPVNM